MITVKGVYENGKIKLSKPLELEENANVIITFLDADDDEPVTSHGGKGKGTAHHHDPQDDAYYEGLRAHKRFKASGNINILHPNGERQYPLNDYSAGGLSFFAEQTFTTNKKITATFKYNAAGELLVMEFEMEVRRVIEKDGKYMIGCQFLDNIDEELWHTVMAQ